ncbi:hypothetical protein Pme01_61190 [Planosporangium mesophilum]|uniref:Uncharacterized protein n=1 Tax=Planosporangium mesophilum TaxID=689768 RepID=A0A8J3TIU1_9ACTN|nr:hypothetical protein Pme01_61190 [Planosporangium mesophilum]
MMSAGPAQSTPANGWEYDRNGRLVQSKGSGQPAPNQPVRWLTVLWLLVALGVGAVVSDLVDRWTAVGPVYGVLSVTVGTLVVDRHRTHVQHRWSAAICGIPAVVILPVLAKGLLSPGMPGAYAWAIGSFAAAAVYAAVTRLPSRQ